MIASLLANTLALGQTAFSAPYDVGIAADIIQLIDHDQDGDIDVLAANSNGATIWIVRNLGNGGFLAPQVLADGFLGISGFVCAHLDADAEIDLVVAERDQSGCRVKTTLGSGPTSTVFASTGSVSGLFVVDASRDGFEDLYFTHVDTDFSGGPVRRLKYGNNEDGHVTVYSAGYEKEVLQAVSGEDASWQLLVQDFVSFELELWDLTDGSQVAIPAQNPPLPLWSADAGDFDGDGDQDIRSLYGWAQPSLHQAEYVGPGLGVGLGEYQPSNLGPMPYGMGAGPRVRAAELDGDGLVDIVVRGTSLYWIRSLPGGLITEALPVVETSPLVGAVELGDIDGDGRVDLAFVRVGEGLFWVRNLLEADCDTNGISDADEIASDPSLDCNANGIPDACDIAAGSSLDQDGNGFPDECLTPLLSADVTELPGLDGGTQHFTLTAGQDFGLKFYLLLGTLSGTSSGFPIGDMTLPLNIFDPYFSLTLQQPNSGAFVNTFGVFNFLGTANASLVVPPGTQFPSLIGLTFHHAYLVFQPDLTVSLVSNAVELTLH